MARRCPRPVTITPSYPSIAALGVVGGVVFLLITSMFDRQEH